MKEKYDNVVGEKEGGRREGGIKEEWREEGRKEGKNEGKVR